MQCRISNLQYRTHAEETGGVSHRTTEGVKVSTVEEEVESLWVRDRTRRLLHTYILDIIGSYSLVAAIYGALSYNNNVQPFLIGAVLEGCKEAEAFTNMTENCLHFQKLDPMMEGNLDIRHTEGEDSLSQLFWFHCLLTMQS